MTKFLKPVVSWLRLTKRIGSAYAAYKLLPEIYTPDLRSRASKRGGKVEFGAYGKKFSKEQIALFGKHGELLLKFVKSKCVAFANMGSEKEQMLIKHNDSIIQMFVNDYDNLKVIEEVFIDRLYDLQMPGKYIVLDIGMNVAAASLYFAGLKNVEKVYGFEPFLQTFQQAGNNIGLNSGLSSKIEIHNCGLGEKNQWVNVPAPAAGSLGGSTTESFIAKLPDHASKELIKVEIRDIEAEVKAIKTRHPKSGIIIKMDCEGAEYEIMERLSDAKMVGDISAYMIEYHHKGKEVLQDILSDNSFIILSPGDDAVSEYGMLYAINSKETISGS